MCGTRCCAVCVLLFSVLTYFLSVPQFSSAGLEPSLAGQVAVVTGGSRGIGKGIAIGLGEAGATVYVTGRTLSKGDSNIGGINGVAAPGSLEETCEAVVAAGGKCIPVAADNGKDEALEALFERVMAEQGRLDILVNNAFSAVSFMPRHHGKAFWEKPLETWDQVNNVGLRSHYLASVLAARKMAPAKRGLIVNIGSFGGINYIFDVAYGIGKAAMDRMANDMAVELFTENITMIGLWPGLVKTENVEAGALDGVAKLAERRGLPPGMPAADFKSMMPTPLAETPLFNGRAVAAFARDPQKLQHTGKVLVPALMAADYGIVDERGVRSPSMISVKAGLAQAARPLLEKLDIWSVPGGCYSPKPEASDAAKFFWNTLPDLNLPGKLLKLGSGAPNL